jgi:hypothetical protein
MHACYRSSSSLALNSGISELRPEDEEFVGVNRMELLAAVHHKVALAQHMHAHVAI